MGLGGTRPSGAYGARRRTYFMFVCPDGHETKAGSRILTCRTCGKPVERKPELDRKRR